MRWKLKIHSRLSVLEVKVTSLEENIDGMLDVLDNLTNNDIVFKEKLEMAEETIERLSGDILTFDKRLKDVEEAMASIYPSARKRAQ